MNTKKLDTKKRLDKREDECFLKIRILDKGDKVIGFHENKIAVQKKSGEAVLYLLEEDENGFPRISREKSCMVTFGNCEIESKSNKNDVKVTTF
jgi:hypothetical protein